MHPSRIQVNQPVMKRLWCHREGPRQFTNFRRNKTDGLTLINGVTSKGEFNSTKPPTKKLQQLKSCTLSSPFFLLSDGER